MSEVMRAVPDEPLLGAIARGWCHPANSHKQMDADLANAIADEVNKWLAAAPAPVDGLVNVLDAQKLLEWNRAQCEPPIKIGYELAVYAAAALQSRDEPVATVHVGQHEHGPFIFKETPYGADNLTDGFHSLYAAPPRKP